MNRTSSVKVDRVSNYQPVGCRVAVVPEDPGETSKGGLYIPETARDKAVRAADGGVVYAVGPRVSPEYCTVATPDGGERLLQPGDHVRFVTYSGVQFHDNRGQVVHVVNDQDIFAVKAKEENEKGSE